MTGTIAVLNNVTKMAEVCSAVVDRKPGSPGFGLFSGPAGYGKSMASTYCANKFDGFYVECDSTMTQKDFIEAVMIELGIIVRGKSYNKRLHQGVLEIGEFLADHPRKPLFIDEADFLVERKKIELVRDIYKKCADAGTSIFLIGEPGLPLSLRKWERVYSRILKKDKAEALSLKDIQSLAELICSNLEFSPTAIEAISKRIHGSARRAVNLFNEIEEHAVISDWNLIEAKQINSIESED